MQLQTIALADGIEAAIDEAEGEAEDVAIEGDSAVEIVDEELRRESGELRRRHDQSSSNTRLKIVSTCFR